MNSIQLRPAYGAVLVAVAVLGLSTTACTHGNVASGDGLPAASRPSATAGPMLTRPVAGQAPMASYLDGLAASGRFSGTVLVARAGQVLLDAGYGLADRATRTPNGPATIFQIGSVTK